MGKIFGLDYGRSRVGLASCHTLLKIPTPFLTFRMLDTPEKSALALAEIIKKGECSLLIVGLPLELSGKEGAMALETKRFVALLEPHLSGIKIHYIDERLTSAQGEKAMKEMDFNRKKRAQGSDTMSACLILETYLAQIFH